MANGAMHLEVDFYFVQQHFNEVCRRRARRFNFELGEMAYLVNPDDVTNRAVLLHDISQSGIAFCSDKPMEPGTKLILNLNKNTASGPVRLHALVVHSTQQPRGNWRIGCEFVRELTPEMLDEVV